MYFLRLSLAVIYLTATTTLALPLGRRATLTGEQTASVGNYEKTPLGGADWVTPVIGSIASVGAGTLASLDRANQHMGGGGLGQQGGAGPALQGPSPRSNPDVLDAIRYDDEGEKSDITDDAEFWRRYILRCGQSEWEHNEWHIAQREDYENYQQQCREAMRRLGAVNPNAQPTLPQIQKNIEDHEATAPGAAEPKEQSSEFSAETPGLSLPSLPDGAVNFGEGLGVLGSGAYLKNMLPQVLSSAGA